MVDGMYYPNSTITLEGRKAHWLGHPSTIYVKISTPIPISEIGEMTYGWEIADPGWKSPVARLEFPKYSVYMVVQRLTATGRLEYSERNSSIKDFIRHHPIYTILIGIGLLIIVITFLSWLFSNSSRRRAPVYKSYNQRDYSSRYSTVNSSSDSYGDSGSYSSSSSVSSEYDETDEDSDSDDQKEKSHSRSECPDCNGIDIGSIYNKGNGQCKHCDGSGHDRTGEAWASIGSLGTDDSKYDCDVCSGTGQCQTCGGTGFIYSS